MTRLNVRMWLAVVALLACMTAQAVQFTQPKREFRSSWIATVWCLDWPNENSRGTTVAAANKMKQVFAECDVVSLHCPLTPETRCLVNRERLALMKPTAILINTSRGMLVDEQALADALNEKRLFAAGLDVLPLEPPKDGSPLLTARNCFITPHLGWASKEARIRLIRVVEDNIRAFQAGKPVNVVS